MATDGGKESQQCRTQAHGDGKVRRPRICAHRGLSVACPENTLPAFGAALAVGADEIEFDLRLSHDGVAVVSHEPDVGYATLGKGDIGELDWHYIRSLDAGVKFGNYGAANTTPNKNGIWQGIHLPRLEEVLELTAGRIGLNIHVKETGPEGALVKIVCDLLRRHNLLDLAYIAAASEEILQAAQVYAPEVARACLAGNFGSIARQIDVAVKYNCRRIQLFKAFDAAQVQRAHDLGLICNYFMTDNPAEAQRLIAGGVDVILTNQAHVMLAGLGVTRCGVIG